MAYVPVPKDLNAVKTKVMFNLTKRQILCFGGGALIGVPLFFLLKGPQTKTPQESSHEPSESRSTRRLQEQSVRISERSPPRTASPFSGCTPTACAA